MNRRSLLKALALGTVSVASSVLDVDRLLWVPGARTIHIPQQPTSSGIDWGLTPANTLVTPEWVIREAVALIMNKLAPLQRLHNQYESKIHEMVQRQVVVSAPKIVSWPPSVNWKSQ